MNDRAYLLLSKYSPLLMSLFLVSCGSGGSSSQPMEMEMQCSAEELEAEMDEQLALATSEVDFSFVLKRQDDREYRFNRGGSTLQTLYESASTSKLVSATVILRLVELGFLDLSDRPQDYINTWPINVMDPLYNITLAQLLSFTSGLEDDPLCINIGLSNFENCVNTIATQNANNGVVPGEAFYYGSSHLQVAGLMAIRAFGANNWEEVFSDFKNQTGLFPNSTYDLPSIANPRLAGGMHWVGEDYLAFLTALKDGDILNSDSMAILLTDHTQNVLMANSPVFDSLMEDWHYGFGLWHECESTMFNCEAGLRVSSPGAFGSYPYWDTNINYIGLVARQGALGTFENGMAIERSVRETAEQWAACL